MPQFPGDVISKYMLKIITHVFMHLSEGKDGFLVNTPSCKILDIDPWHSSITKYVHKQTKPLSCLKYHQLITLESGVLSPVTELVKMAGEAKCFYQMITRNLTEPNDNNWKYGALESLPLQSDTAVKVTEDFLRVNCMKGNNVFYEDFLTQVNTDLYHARKDKMNLSPDPKLSTERYRTTKIDEKLNVLMIGVDGVSRLNSRRQFTKLRDYMINQLNGYDLRGYNRIGDNTFLNLVGLLLGVGIKIDELKWMSKKFFDDQPFVWKRFMANGYASAYVEDATYGCAFNFVKSGFSKAPTHHYYRPFGLALEKSAVYKRSPRWCGGRKALHMWTLDYLRQFAMAYHTANTPYFGFVFNTYLSHDNINDIGKADGEYTEFMRWLNEKNILNNTVVIIFGDHGFRYGGIRSTYVGRYEENLPMILMAFPPWFRRKYPAYEQAFRGNRDKLTTPFDVHATLRDLCPGCEWDKPIEYGISLFQNITASRSCNDAGIPVHYCACRQEQKVSVEDTNVVQAGAALLRRINEFNSQRKDVCTQQELTRIIDASTTVHDQTNSSMCVKRASLVCYDSKWHKMKTTFTLYLVTIQTHPGVGQFQATVRKEGNKYEVLGDISRINLYGNTSSCITDDFNLKKICYCKSNMKS